MCQAYFDRYPECHGSRTKHASIFVKHASIFKWTHADLSLQIVFVLKVCACVYLSVALSFCVRG